MGHVDFFFSGVSPIVPQPLLKTRECRGSEFTIEATGKCRVELYRGAPNLRESGILSECTELKNENTEQYGVKPFHGDLIHCGKLKMDW